MKKLLVVVFMVIWLAACGSEETNSGNTTSNPSSGGFTDEELVLSTVERHGDFEVRLTTEKLNYAVDEPIKVYAELVYVGDQEEIEIGHAMYPIGSSVTEHTRNIKIYGVMEEPYRVTLLKKDQPIRYDYSFSGGYSDQDDPKYVSLVKELMDNQWPEGRYTITATANFNIHGSDPVEQYNFDTAIHFIVQ